MIKGFKQPAIMAQLARRVRNKVGSDLEKSGSDFSFFHGELGRQAIWLEKLKSDPDFSKSDPTLFCHEKGAQNARLKHSK